ncbi:MAG: aspartate-semialdehyde dehydrogenase [Planctomycetota bacterium]
MTSKVAVVGATGAVGRELVKILESRSFPVGGLTLFASGKRPGRTLRYRSDDLPVRPLGPESFRGLDLVFFATSAGVSREWVPVARSAGGLVIDNSSAFRSDPEVPLVVPEVNGDCLATHRGLIANPNCSTILLVLVLHPLSRLAPLSRVVVATYQAVSGAGQAGVEDLENQLRARYGGSRQEDAPARAFPHEIAHNLIPAIGPTVRSGASGEESKMQSETGRILGLKGLKMSATCVRVPVPRVHCEAVHLAFERPVTSSEVRRRLAAAPGVVILDDPSEHIYPTPQAAEGRDEVLVGRIRPDLAMDGGVALFLAGDQLRKGAALNAVQIAERAIP